MTGRVPETTGSFFFIKFNKHQAFFPVNYFNNITFYSLENSRNRFLSLCIYCDSRGIIRTKSKYFKLKAVI